MKFISVRLITDNITRLVQFYEHTLGTKANWATPDFAEIVTSVGTLAIGSTKTLAFFGTGVAVPKANKSAILEFRVTDVDKDYARAKEFIPEIVQEPTTMPWGNRSFLFRDPDGNLVNLLLQSVLKRLRNLEAKPQIEKRTSLCPSFWFRSVHAKLV